MDKKVYIALGFLIGTTIATIVDTKLKKFSDRIYCENRIDDYAKQYGIAYDIFENPIDIRIL